MKFSLFRNIFRLFVLNFLVYSLLGSSLAAFDIGSTGTSFSLPYRCQIQDDQVCNYLDTSSIGQTVDTETRSLALPNRLLENDFNVFVNPGQLMNYGTAYLEGWRGGNNVWGGATIPLPGNQKLGVFLRRPTNTLSAAGSVATLFNTYKLDGTTNLPGTTATTIPVTGSSAGITGTQYGILDTTRKGFGNIDLLYATGVSGMNLGFRLSYANVSASEEKNNPAAGITKSIEKVSTHDIQASVGAQIKSIGPGYLDATLTFGTLLSSYSYEETAATGVNRAEISGGFPITLGALFRYILPSGENRMIFALNIDYYNVPLNLSGQNAAGTSLHALEAGSGMFNTTFDFAYHQKFEEQDLKVIYSTGLGYLSTGYALKTTANPSGATDIFGGNSLDLDRVDNQFYVPLGIAAEHQTFETIKTRIGVRKNIMSFKSGEQKTIVANTDTTRNFSNQFFLDDELQVAMGLGWVPVSKVQIDLAMNADAFNLTTFFSAVSVRYHY
ncbi:MAG: hypothetical protein KDK38_05785 [Leptospiraceae bacterium]|nr:hypothetical protein [Leptospiraceae bacterium]